MLLRGFMKAYVLVAMLLVSEGHRIQSSVMRELQNRGARERARSNELSDKLDEYERQRVVTEPAESSSNNPLTMLTALLAANPKLAYQLWHAGGLHKPSAAAEARSVSRQPVMQETETKKETYEFEAEVGKVMDIIINSLYSDKDIFMRELVSNAADACDKKKFSRYDQQNAETWMGRIRIKVDKEASKITIEDNGVGMTREELQTNLGRIAQSGTKKFAEAIQQGGAEASNLIGQFGVGFYSSFLVADKVQVISRPSLEGGEVGPQMRWESSDAKSYTIEPDDTDLLEGSGTRLVLTMKEDADSYMDDYKVRELLKKYSEFVSFPVELWAEKTEYETVPDPDKEAKEGEPAPTKTVPKTSRVWDRVNVAEPIWMRQPKEVTKEEYDEFYKTTFKLYDEPMAYSHFMLEGQVEFRSVLFLPTDVPWELSQDMFNEVVKNVRLYVKRVFISESFKDQLLPRWLTFIKAIVDSDDLPLNVSRELLQKSRVLNIISKRLVRKAIDMFADLKEESPEKFTKLQRNFGQYLKVGVIEDNDNKERLLNLACFKSSSEEGRGERGTNLEEYVQRMPEGQKQIYYIAGTSRANAESSPVLEKLKKRGYEVLFALDQIDEIALQGIGRFKATGDKEFAVIDASKEDAKLDDLTEEEKKVEEKAKEDFADTLAFIKETLGSSKVDKVEVSTRLVDSPSALVQPQWGMSPQMQRFMKQRAKMEGEQVSGMNMAANLEVNTAHPAVQKVKTLKESGNEAAAKDMANLIYDVAAISSGYDVAEPASFAKRVIALMAGEELGQDATGAGAEDTKPKDSGKDEPDIQTPDPSDVEVID